jgi:mannitol 2-dehydrogenase
MKICILNGGHASLCYPSALLGVDYVHESMGHPTIGPFLDCLERNEIIPTVPPVPNTDLEDYWKIIAQRFSNPTVADTIRRNCYDGFNRQPKFIVPVAKEALKKGESVDGLALVSAMWCRYCQGTREDGSTIEPNDPIWEQLQERALKAKKDPPVWLEMKEVYGDVGQNKEFVEAFTKALENLDEVGVEGAMKRYIESKELTGSKK